MTDRRGSSRSQGDPSSCTPSRVGEADAALAVEEVSPEVAATTGVIETDEAGCVTRLVEKPAEPSSTLVTTGCYVLPEDIFHTCALLQPSAESESQLSEAVELLLRAGYGVATVRLGERVNVSTPEVWIGRGSW